MVFACEKSESVSTNPKGNGEEVKLEDNANIVKIVKGRFEYNPVTKKYDKLINLQFHCTGWTTPEGKVVTAGHCFLAPPPLGAKVHCADGTTIDLEGPFGPMPVNEEALRDKNCTIPLSVLRTDVFKVEAAGKIYDVKSLVMAPEFLERNTMKRNTQLDLAVITLVDKTPGTGLTRAASLPAAKAQVEFTGFGLRVDPGFIDADRDLMLNDEDACPLTPFALRYKKDSSNNTVMGPDGMPVPAVDSSGCGVGEIQRVGKLKSITSVPKGTGPVLRKGTNFFAEVDDGFLKIIGPATLFPGPDQNLPANGDSGAPLRNKAGEVIGLVHGGRFEFDSAAGQPATNADGVPLLQGLFTDLTDPVVKAFLEAELAK